MNLEEIRKDIDKVDSQIAQLFMERMELDLQVDRTLVEHILGVVNHS